jgi:hypothetical protein
MTWKKIGKVGVDSGNLMLVDPAYIKSELPNYRKLVGMKGSGRNLKSDKKNSRQIKNKIGQEVAVTFESGFGDGLYNVYADIGKVGKFGRRVKSVRVDMVTPREKRLMNKLI